MDEKWNELYAAALKAVCPRKISEMMEAGGVAAAVESESGKIYTGVCVDTACSLGVCAERNAIFNMITNGESRISKVVAVDQRGKVLPPCGACREFMIQLMPKDYSSIEIMLDQETKKIVTLKSIAPEWWL